MLRNRYDPMNLIDLVPTLSLSMDPELTQIPDHGYGADPENPESFKRTLVDCLPGLDWASAAQWRSKRTRVGQTRFAQPGGEQGHQPECPRALNHDGVAEGELRAQNAVHPHVERLGEH